MDTHTHMYANLSLHTYIPLCIHTYVYMHVCMYGYVYMLGMYMCRYVYRQTCECVCMHMLVCVFMLVCIYVGRHVNKQTFMEYMCVCTYIHILQTFIHVCLYRDSCMSVPAYLNVCIDTAHMHIQTYI